MKPRPPILLTVAYGAGLATGLLHVGTPAAVAAVSLGLALSGQPLARLIGTGAVLGRLGGELAWMTEASACTRRLPERPLRLRIRVLEPSDGSGGRIAILPLRAGCTGKVVARWPRRFPAKAGAEFSVIGSWVPRAGRGGRPGGSLMVVEARALASHPSLSARLRTHLFSTSRTLYGARAPVIDALILGSQGGIDPELQDRFARSGLVHLLSISGFHIGLIAAWVFLAARMLGMARPRALVVGAVVSLAYVGFLGWPAPATRAAALAGVLARSHLRQRRVQPNALLAATCLCVLLVDPWAVLDLGGWLSATALWGATTFTRWTDRSLGPSLWWRTLGSSVGATLATAPITSWALGTVALAGIALNFVAIPLAAAAVPGVLASLLLQPLWDGGARALAAGSGLALHLLELAAAGGAAIPGGHRVFEPGAVQSVLPWLLALGLGLWAIGERNTLAEALRRIAWSGTTLLWVGLAHGVGTGSTDGPGELALHFLDVGQGDGALLRTPAGRWVLIDAGPAGDRTDAGRRVVAPFLARQGARRLAVVVLSHAHADHLGGLHSVLQRFPAGLVIEPGSLVGDPLYGRFLGSLATGRIPWHPGRAGERFTLDGIGFTVLHPDPSWPGWGEDVNEDSLVLLVEFGRFQAVFAGDAGMPSESFVRRRLIPVDLLKVGHHGSRGSTGDEWLEALDPKVAIISVGRNEYGHPAPETLRRLAAHRVDVRRTDLDGTVSVTTDGRRMTVRWARHNRIYDAADERN